MAVVLQGEVGLPAAGQGMLYAAEARVALAIPWLDLQRVALAGLERLHALTGTDVAAFFGRRIALDRRNQPVAQITLCFVMEGQTDKEALEQLDLVMRQSQVRFGTGAVEMVAPTSFPSLYAKSGRIYQLWTMVKDQPRSLWLRLEDEQILTEVRAPETSSPKEFLPYARHVIGLGREPGPADRHLDALRVAFALHFARRIVEADGVLDADELTYLGQHFPPDLLRAYDLDDEQRFAELRDEALGSLGQTLGHHDKLALIGLFFQACHADGALDARELTVMREAAENLGIGKDEVVNYLRRLW